MKYISIFLFVILGFHIIGQNNTLNVAENTIKIKALGEESFYYAFAEGDQIVFSFQEQNGNTVKQFEILEYPDISRFTEYKSKNIENHKLVIPRSGVYVFKFTNGSVFGRICKLKIDRIPLNETTKSFNTAVKWVEKTDTTWDVYTKEIVTGYDTLFLQKTKRELVSKEQVEELHVERNERVHSTGSLQGINKTSLFFSLPENIYFGKTTKKVVCWAYWVGVGEESTTASRQNCQIISGLVKGLAGYAMTPLGGLLVGKITDLVVPKTGQYVSYGIVNGQNRDLFLQDLQYRAFDFGKGIAGYKKFVNLDLLQGTFHIILSNDNLIQGIDVNVKVVALVETNTYEDKPYTEQKLMPRKEYKSFKELLVTIIKIPLAVGN